MAHLAAKLPACANCYYAFVPDEPDEFCPRCGQQNQAPDLRLGHVLEEALEGFFHFDGKVWRTARLLLFRPGELTRRFLAGHRMPYVPPIRLYVFISFVFFFMLSLLAGREKREPAQIKKAAATAGVQKIARPRPAAVPADEDADPEVDSMLATLPAAQRRVNDTTNQAHRRNTLLLSLNEIKRLPPDPTEAQVDSVVKSKGRKPGFVTRLLVRRTVRWRNSTREELVHQMLRGGSILLFLLMPLAALLLKLAYFRRERHYLGHLIFTIHLHCFIFVLLLLSEFLSLLLPERWDVSGWLMPLLGIYFVLALRRVYAQGWAKTLVKSLLLGFSYCCVFVFALVAVGLLGAAIF